MAGNMWWQEKGDITQWGEEGSPVEQINVNGSDVMYGLGTSYSFTKYVSIKLEYQQSLINGRTANPLALGLDVKF